MARPLRNHCNYVLVLKYVYAELMQGPKELMRGPKAANVRSELMATTGTQVLVRIRRTHVMSKRTHAMSKSSQGQLTHGNYYPVHTGTQVLQYVYAELMQCP